MIVGLLFIIIGILLSVTGFGAVFGIPLAIIGGIIFILAIMKGAVKGTAKGGIAIAKGIGKAAKRD